MRKSIIAVIVLSAVSTSAFATSSLFVGAKDYAADKKAQSERDASQDAAIHQVHMNTLGKYSESWGLEDRANIAKLQEQKLDKSVFTADQQRQDKHINAVQDAAQSANEKADGLAVRADGIEKQAGIIDGRVGATEVRADLLEQGQREQNTQMESDRKQRVDADVALSGRIDKTVKDNIQQDKNIAANSSDITALYGNSAVQSKRLDAANNNIAANRRALDNTNQVVSQHSKQLANHEQRLSDMQKGMDSKFSQIDKRFNDIDKRFDAGLSGVAAMANIPQVTEYQTFAVGAGVGARGSESAIAVGFSARASQNVVLKASVAGDSQQKWTVGGGLSYGW